MKEHPTDHGSYLDRVRFDPKLFQSFVAKWVMNIRLVSLLLIAIIFLGVINYFNLPRRLNPEINIPIITIVTVFPGASPQDVESLVTIPIENKVRGISGIDTLTSVSRGSVSVVSMQFLSTIPSEKAKNDVQSAVDTVGNLPDEVQDSSVTALDFEDQPVWTFAVSSQGNIPSLMNFSKTLKESLSQNSKIDRVILTGYEEQEIAVVVSPEKVQQYGVNPLLLSQAVRSAVVSYPAGPIQTIHNTFSLTIDPLVSSVEDIRALRVTVDDVTVRLGDIATVMERSKANQQLSYLATGEKEAERVVTFDIYKSSSSNIDAAAKAAHEIVEAESQKYHDAFQIQTITNTAEEIDTQFYDLLGEFRSTILLVFLNLFIFLGLRQAIISSFTVPLTFLMAFVFMNALGMSINFLSLFAFLLALGLLVDDTIVVVQAMTTYYRTGKFTPQETGLMVWRDTIVPIWSTTITTIWSFVPLLLSTGIIGEFIKPIPVVVTVTMVSSTAIAVLITLPLMVVLLKPSIPHRVVILARVIALIAFLAVIFMVLQQNPLFPVLAIFYLIAAFLVFRFRAKIAPFFKKRIAGYPKVQRLAHLASQYSNRGVIDMEVVGRKYYRLILRILGSASARRNVIIAIIIYAIVSFAFLPFGLVKNEFFPRSESDLVYVTLEKPQGTNVETLQHSTEKFMEDIRKTEGIDFTTAQIGAGVPGFGGSGGGNQTLFTLRLPKKEDRHISSLDIADDLRSKYKGDGTITVSEVSGGPPAGADLQITLLGSELGQLNTYADEIIEYLKQQPGVTTTSKSIKQGTSAITFVPDTQKMQNAGVSIESVGLWLRTYASGFTLDSVNFDKSTQDETDVIFSFGAGNPTVEDIAAISISTRDGYIPLSALGSLQAKVSPTEITREDGKRTLAVQAGVAQGYSITDENKKLETFAGNMHLADGYSWKTGGVNEENAKSVQSILQAMVVAFMLILVTMVIQFGSYRQAVIVLLVIPLAVSSVFLIFGLTGTPLSFPALIGVLSLFGIVVTNSMFIVDKININMRQGMEFKQAIADAGASRLEPIVLTKISTILGLLPITIADPLWRGLGGAIISGLLMASSIMLLFIPVVYYSWMKPSDSSK